MECCALCGRAPTPATGPRGRSVRISTCLALPRSSHVFGRVCLNVVHCVQGELPDNPVVNFTAHTLLCGAAAVRVLQRTSPELLLDQAEAVVVNLGEMSIAGLPVGILAASS